MWLFNTDYNHPQSVCNTANDLVRVKMSDTIFNNSSVIS